MLQITNQFLEMDLVNQKNIPNIQMKREGGKGILNNKIASVEWDIH